MKRAITALLMCALPAGAGTIISDGQGFIPVLVQVLAEDRSPVRGAEVSLTDLRRHPGKPLIPEAALKLFEDSLGKPVKTDEKGCAVVWFHGRYGATSVDGKVVKYSQSLDGTLVVRRGEKEVYRKPLWSWARETGYRPTGNDTPWVQIDLGKPAPEAARRSTDGDAAADPDPADSPEDRPLPEK